VGAIFDSLLKLCFAPKEATDSWALLIKICEVCHSQITMNDLTNQDS